MNKFYDYNLVEILDSYLALRKLEENQDDYFGCTEVLMSYFPKSIIELCDYVYTNYDLILKKYKYED